MNSQRAEYTVIPQTAHKTIPPITFVVRVDIASIQDYLTPAEARELAQALMVAALAVPS